MNPPLSAGFYNRAPVVVARELLGKILVRRIDDEVLTGRIVETEAYLGIVDAASHSSLGKTKRTRILFERAGLAYIYQLRAYFLLNIVTEEVGVPTCVLLRALEPLQGVETMRLSLGLSSQNERQKAGQYVKQKETKLMNGPGKLCRAMQINLSHYGTDVTDAASPFYITEDVSSAAAANFAIETSARIGVTKAADLPYRFTIKGNAFLSR